MTRVVSFTEPGGHPLNEDAFIAEPHPLDADCRLCFLADGQGGRHGGARAAHLACAEAHTKARNIAPKRLANPMAWGPILNHADAAVSADPDAGFTTLIGFCIVGQMLFGASSGDSAVWLVNGDGTSRELTAIQRKNPPIGSGNADVIPFSAHLAAPWKVLAMSDGVWKYVGWERIIEWSKTHRGQELVDMLQERARLPGNRKFQDDFTVVVMESE